MLSLDEYKAIYEASPDGHVVVREDGSIRSANARIEQLFGWRPDELVGRRIEVLVPGVDRARHVEHRAGFVADPHSRPMGVGLDLRGEHRDGSTFPVEVSLSPWRQVDGELAVICSIRDVTAYRRLRNFSEGALLATEEERMRIARELHDDTAQRLATLILRVRTLTLEEDRQRREGLFQDVREEIIAAADGVKRMSRGLRPPEIEELGLVHAIAAHARSVQEGTGFGVDTELDMAEPALDQTTKLALYRIVQEALSNARRHSGAGSATVRLEQDDDRVVVEVHDTGRGFKRSLLTEGDGGLGLIGMHERAAMIGGRLDVETAPDRGTSVLVTVTLGASTHA